MTSPQDDSLWRNRFIIVNLVRIGATLVVLFALILWQTDTFVEGGSTVVGLPLAVAGVIVSFLAPAWLARHWKARDRR